MLDYTLNTVKFLTGNRILNLALIACLLAQVCKVIVILISERRLNWVKMFETGGMPSSHSALVVALCVGVARVCGTGSVEFAIAVCFALIVMYDASNVRRAAGEQAKMLNLMIEHWSEMNPEVFGEKLKEILGHTPFEVIVGAILGLCVGLLPI